jgi:hypothetical protein
MNSGTPSTPRRANAWRCLPALTAIFATGVFAIPATSRAPAPAPLEIAPVPRVALRIDSSHARRRCESCGRVQSIRHVEATNSAPESFEFTVRLYDGTVRMNSSATAGNWQAGDSIILLGGVPSPGHLPREQT